MSLPCGVTCDSITQRHPLRPPNRRTLCSSAGAARFRPQSESVAMWFPDHSRGTLYKTAWMTKWIRIFLFPFPSCSILRSRETSPVGPPGDQQGLSLPSSLLEASPPLPYECLVSILKATIWPKLTHFCQFITARITAHITARILPLVHHRSYIVARNCSLIARSIVCLLVALRWLIV